MSSDYLFTSESVTPGHPDKICDNISDAILDNILEKDRDGRVAIEALITTGYVQIAGQISTSAYVNIQEIARKVILDIGYNSFVFGFDGASCGINVAIDEQSPEIYKGVFGAKCSANKFDKQGAGDQGIMFGYACTDTKDFMPASISLAHKLSKQLTHVRQNEIVDGLGPDGKTQVTFAYENGVPKYIDTILVVSQHLKSKSIKNVRNDILEFVIKPTLNESGYELPKNILINPAGKFNLGGPLVDTGLTGRKIIVDTYGGAALSGGGAFSGKDPSKVDRSVAYILRQIAKSVVANKYAKKCEIGVSYALGIAKPISIFVNSFGTGDDKEILKKVNENFDLRPLAIIEKLGLKDVAYQKVCNFGHFGGNSYPWEKVVKF